MESKNRKSSEEKLNKKTKTEMLRRNGVVVVST